MSHGLSFSWRGKNLSAFRGSQRQLPVGDLSALFIGLSQAWSYADLVSAHVTVKAPPWPTYVSYSFELEWGFRSDPRSQRQMLRHAAASSNLE